MQAHPLTGGRPGAAAPAPRGGAALAPGHGAAPAAPPPPQRDPDDLGLGGLSPRAVTLVSLWVACAPATVALFSVLSPTVLPCTPVVTYAFCRFSRRAPTRSRLAAYCVFGGAAAGWVNAIACVWLTRLTTPRLSSGVPFDVVCILGVGFGIVYGGAYLPPLFLQRTWAGLRRPLALGRTLIGCGLWGLVATAAALGWLYLVWRRAFPHGHDHEAAVLALAGLSLLVHAAMLAVGAIGSWRRWSWLLRLRQGRIAGYTIVDGTQFSPEALVGVPLFSRPLLGSPSAAPRRVIARTSEGNGYRHEPLVPRFKVH